ncbi:septum site-determining protein MinC [Cupriavidus metallidurans]|jgi:septum site-determining protein MinC|uniref:Probable septum site-determining protein MinC n=1 Tax=Cupriavidus metallidurans (strain ATCC 43123 / DSM 2839 / NBRC 102507 / CH34) TaxID=266264 RepID=MINC_CUPMC|nr:septum site-determining protein MinC [Cupriavidus metallidurans]Q1LSF5.1 RecName: Full=Probable septum site-determining protein MinC [Cupriavidus metallidurans CH34]ABF06921.1 cell division inhibitor MinC [Cupriavidus metallidurans CH34]AVA37561.1 septum site-determining protein MinC [Cupriavidus metallidurans]KWW33898.1 Septum site-determining protein MinC [Cupriavidus metallidurans]MDE4916343.1 septum site-determining protein MinC [Cupriavidus metallidurans]QGS28720.1 septum site-determi
MSQKKSPRFELRSGNVDALLLALNTADLDAVRDDLLSRFESTPDFFSDDVVALDLRRLEGTGALALDRVIDTLATLKARAIGVVARADQRDWAGGFGLPLLDSQSRRGGKDEAPKEKAGKPEATAASGQTDAEAAGNTGKGKDSEGAAVNGKASEIAEIMAAANAASAPRAIPTLLIDKPLRSGQQIYAQGDVVILDLVSYGAEVIAEGNIHIYAPLRGRALAGVKGNPDARIFCTCLEPELISIAGIYRTAEQTLPADVLGKSAQVRLADEKLILEPLRMK